jgi:hypothetical protein
MAPLINRDGLTAAIAIRGRLGLKFNTVDKANAVADCIDNQFTPHDLCDENHERRVKARVQFLLDPSERISQYDLLKLINSLKFKKACGLMVFETNASGIFQEDHWFT